MIVDVEVQRRAKSLNEGNRTGAGVCVSMARLPDQVRGNDALYDAQHAPHDLGSAG